MSGGYYSPPGSQPNQPQPIPPQPYQPQPQQNPYGGPPPQAPYPAPPHPPNGAYPPPPPPGGHRRGSKKPAFAVLAVILVLALAGVGAWMVLGSGEDDSDGGRPAAVDPNLPGGRMWSVNEEGVDDGKSPMGFWPVGDTVVKATGTTLTAYAMADGSEAWTLELEGEHLCAPSNATAEGLLVVGHGESNCGQNITQIDLNTGEQGWSRPLEPNGNPLSFHIAMAGSSYAVQTLGGWSVHSVADGEEIDSAIAGYDALGEALNYQGAFEEFEIDVVNGDEVCAVTAVVGGEALIRQRTCATVNDAASGALSPPFSRLEEIDPATGETLWSLDLPEGRWLEKINSTSPLVVTLRDEEFGGELELAFIDQGQITGQVPIETTGLAADDTSAWLQGTCRETTVVYSPPDDCGGMAVHGDRLYASPSTIFSDPIVTAMNATTGEVAWQYKAEDFSGQLVLGADENGVIVYQAGFDESLPGQVVRISPDGQKVEPLFRTDGGLFLPGNAFVAFRDGRLVFSPPDYSLEYDIAAYGPDGKDPNAGNAGNSGNAP
ncbi:outer membrane protein assembly factor BamB family protein [Streptomyces sp. 6N223]|uniref:outer membrane protein assembly factor BamB family protein n=1 Tax=Streptomyces sp. 6N223 TaxID=3457412 RepID=UPI003FD39634